jgi:hypothetical protein
VNVRLVSIPAIPEHAEVRSSSEPSSQSQYLPLATSAPPEIGYDRNSALAG